ncbi:hypothetical protein NHQ30_003484 [Ciborinia camelliae]|nr:hypothetical protein NHQ30_003484 [Ciborinia camelliae]
MVTVATIDRPSATMRAARQTPMRRRANARGPGYLVFGGEMLDFVLISRLVRLSMPSPPDDFSRTVSSPIVAIKHE